MMRICLDLGWVGSTDGGYGVNLHFTPIGLGGTGVIRGGAVVALAPDSPRVLPDIVSAARVGEPDIAMSAASGCEQVSCAGMGGRGQVRP